MCELNDKLIFSNMDSAGQTISVLEEILQEKVRRRKFYQKYICCCFYPTKKVKINSAPIYIDPNGECLE